MIREFPERLKGEVQVNKLQYLRAGRCFLPQKLSGRLSVLNRCGGDGFMPSLRFKFRFVLWFGGISMLPLLKVPAGLICPVAVT